MANVWDQYNSSGDFYFLKYFPEKGQFVAFLAQTVADGYATPSGTSLVSEDGKTWRRVSVGSWTSPDSGNKKYILWSAIRNEWLSVEARGTSAFVYQSTGGSPSIDDGMTFLNSEQVVDITGTGQPIAENPSNGNQVVVGAGGKIRLRYANGWQAVTTNTTLPFTEVRSLNNKFIAWGNVSGQTVISYSNTADGASTWTTSSTSIPQIYDMIYVGTTYVATTAAGVYTSTNLTTWTQRLAIANLKSVYYYSGRYTVVGNGGAIRTSTDALTWATVTSSPAANTTNYTQVIHNGERWVAVGNGNNKIIYSMDGLTWVADTITLQAGEPALASGYYPISVASNGVSFVVGGNELLMQTAYKQNTVINIPPMNSVQVSSGAPTILTPAPSGNSYNSWSIAPAPTGIATNATITNVVRGTNEYIAMAGGGIIRSTDGVNWTKTYTPVAGTTIHSIMWDNNRYLASVATSSASSFLLSNDGITWTTSPGNGSPIPFKKIVHNSTHYMGIPTDGGNTLYAWTYPLTAGVAPTFIANDPQGLMANLYDLAWDGTNWLLAAKNASEATIKVYYTPNAAVDPGWWSISTLPSPVDQTKTINITTNGLGLTLVSWGQYVYYSTNYVNWTQIAVSGGSYSTDITEIEWVYDRFIVVAGRFVFTSKDGLTWTDEPSLVNVYNGPPAPGGQILNAISGRVVNKQLVQMVMVGENARVIIGNVVDAVDINVVTPTAASTVAMLAPAEIDSNGIIKRMTDTLTGSTDKATRRLNVALPGRKVVDTWNTVLAGPLWQNIQATSWKEILDSINTETVTFAEAFTYVLGKSEFAEDRTAGLVDYIHSQLNKGLYEGVPLTEQLFKSLTKPLGNDGISLNEFVSLGLMTMAKEIVTLSDSFTTKATKKPNDSTSIAEAQVRNLNKTISESISLEESFQAYIDGKEYIDGLITRERVSRFVTKRFAENIAFSEIINIPQAKSGTDFSVIGEFVARGIIKNNIEHVSIQERITKAERKVINDGLHIVDSSSVGEVPNVGEVVIPGTTFRAQTSQIRVLDAQLNPVAIINNAWDVLVSNSINSEYFVTFSMPANDDKVQYVNGYNYVQVEGQNFKITNFSEERNQAGELQLAVEAQHIFFELDNMYRAETFEKNNYKPNTTPDDLLRNHLISAPFTVVDVAGSLGASDMLLQRGSILANIRSMIDIFGGEFLRDNYKIILRDKIGTDNGIQFRYGKNIQTVKRTTDVRDLTTRLYVYGKDGLTIESVHDKKYLDSANISLYGSIYTKELVLSDVEDPAKLKIAAQKFLDENDQPKITYELTVVELKKLSGMVYNETVNLGDVVTIIDDELGIDIKARIIQYNHYPYEPKESTITIGNFLPRTSDFFSKLRDVGSIVDAAFFKDTGKLNAKWLQGQIDVLNNRVYMSKSWKNVEILEDEGMLLENTDATSEDYGALYLGAGIMAIANAKDQYGKWDFRTFGTGNGFTADVINTGTLNAERIGAGSITIGHLDPNVGVDLDLNKNPIFVSNAAEVTRIGKYAEENRSQISQKANEILLEVGTKHTVAMDAVAGEKAARVIAVEEVKSSIVLLDNKITLDVSKSIRELEDVVNGNYTELDSKIDISVTGINLTVNQKTQTLSDAITAEQTIRQTQVSNLSTAITQSASQIRLEVNSSVTTLQGSLTAEADTRKTAITSLQSSITQTAAQIRSEVNSSVTSLNGQISVANSSITQQAAQITLKVDKAGVISTINQSAEAIKINASKLDITGLVTFNSLNPDMQSKVNSGLWAKDITTQWAVVGTTEINGGRIRTGSVTATQIDVSTLFVGPGGIRMAQDASISWSSIYGKPAFAPTNADNTASNIPAYVVQKAGGQYTYLDAYKISSPRIEGGTIIGSIFKTAESGDRMEITGTGITTRDGSNRIHGIQLDAGNFTTMRFYYQGQDRGYVGQAANSVTLASYSGASILIASSDSQVTIRGGSSNGGWGAVVFQGQVDFSSASYINWGNNGATAVFG